MQSFISERQGSFKGKSAPIEQINRVKILGPDQRHDAFQMLVLPGVSKHAV